MRHSGGFTQTKKKNQAKGAFLYLILLAFVLIDYHKVFYVSIPFCRVPAILCLVLLPFFSCGWQSMYSLPVITLVLVLT